MSNSTGTDTSALSILLNICPFCALSGRSGNRLSCLVVVDVIVVLFVKSTPICSCGTFVPKYLCSLARNMPVAAVSGRPCSVVSQVIVLSWDVMLCYVMLCYLYRLQSLLLATATAYNICLVLGDGIFLVRLF